jgi:GTP cyclohydrolase II
MNAKKALSFVEEMARAVLPTDCGVFTIIAYRRGRDGENAIALVNENQTVGEGHPYRGSIPTS